MLNDAKKLENSGLETVWFMPTLWYNQFLLFKKWRSSISDGDPMKTSINTVKIHDSKRTDAFNKNKKKHLIKSLSH